ncbi:hypothetical protein [Frondihabitans peucedani]|uniref:Glycerophosphoryl diester phosphodiesterase membrane domain-containing protein n=1 Tax=Frondihabitans peucedani TaxID=598626 RepID=A0ABP8E075_9MICO
MSDRGSWATPGDDGDDERPRGEQSGAPQSGVPQPPPQQPSGGPQQPWGPPATAWAPPPRPGLVPLRPLTLGDILGAAFRVFRRNPRTTLGTSLLFNILSFLVSGLVLGGAAFAAYTRISGALPQDRDRLLPGTIAGVAAAVLVPLFLTVVVQALLQAVFVLETSHQVVGEKMRLPGLLRQARGRIRALVGWVILLGLAFFVAFALIAGVVALLAVFGGRGGAVGAVVIGLIGFLGVVVLAVWIGVKTALVPSILLLERLTIRQAVARSWSLTRQSFWRVFGIIALVTVIVGTAANVVGAPVSFLAQIGGGLVQPNGSVGDTSAVVTFIVVSLVGNLLTVLIQAIGAVIQSATVALLYIDLRIRREGLDLELLRYVELRTAGATPLPDPYRTPDPYHTPDGPARP